jgi:GT2 family glycosyltransferase
MSVPRRSSIVIPTKNRAEDLRRTLPTLLEQTVAPAEIIIVDQSRDDASWEVVKDYEARARVRSSAAPRFIYLHEPEINSAGAARNVAIEKASGDILIFLDDDVLLEANFIEEILAPYAQDANIGGVSGVITNYPQPSLIRRWIARLFWTGPFHDERQEIYWHCDQLREAKPFSVRKFGAGLMSVKRQALGEIRFDDRYRGPGEDVDVSWRISERSPLVITSRARLVHVRTSAGAPRDHWLTSDSRSSYYLYLRHWNHGLKNRVCFVWLNIGYAAMATFASLRQASLKPWQALVQGIRLGSEEGDPASYSHGLGKAVSSDGRGRD